MALFAVSMLYVLRIHYRKHRLSAFEFGCWVAVWLSFVGFALVPSVLQGVADVLRIGRVFDLLVIAAFIILSTVVMGTRLLVLKVRDQLEQLVRMQALQRAEYEKEVSRLKK